MENFVENPELKIMDKQTKDVKGRIGLLATIIGAVVGISAISVQIGAMVDGLGYDISRAGTIGMVELGTMSIIIMVTSAFVASIPLARIAALGMAIAITGQVLTALISSFGFIVFARILVGIGTGMAYGAAFASPSAFREPDRVFGQANAGSCFFHILLLYVLPSTAAYGAHKGVFLTLALLGVVLLPFMVWVRSPETSNQPQQTDESNPIELRLVFILFAGIALIACGQATIWSFAERIGSNLNLSASQIGMALAACTFAMGLGSAFASIVGVRFGRIKPMVIAAIFIGVACFITAHSSNFPMYFSSLFFYGFVYLFLTPYLIGFSLSLDPSGRIASLTGGFMWFSYSVGTAIGGYVVNSYTFKDLGWFGLIVCLLAAIPFGLLGLFSKNR